MENLQNQETNTNPVEIDPTQSVVNDKKEIAIELIENWKQKSGIPLEYELPVIDISTTWFYLHATYRGWKITLDINIDNNKIDTYSCSAKKDGYEELEYSEMTLDNLLDAKPLDKELEAGKALLKAKANYAQSLFEIADKYGVIIDE